MQPFNIQDGAKYRKDNQKYYNMFSGLLSTDSTLKYDMVEQFKQHNQDLLKEPDAFERTLKW